MAVVGDLVGGAYRGIAVPKSTPENIRQKLSDIIGKINDDPGFKKKMEDGGFVLTDIPYSKMKEFVDQKKQEYADIAKKIGLKKK